VVLVLYDNGETVLFPDLTVSKLAMIFSR